MSSALKERQNYSMDILTQAFIAVAAALAVQDIFDKEDIFKRAKEMSPYLRRSSIFKRFKRNS